MCSSGSNSAVKDEDEGAAIFVDAEMARLMRLTARRALCKVSDVKVNSSRPHMRKCAACLKLQCATGDDIEKSTVTWDDSDFQRLLVEYEKQVPKMALLPAVAWALPAILRGEADPLNIFFTTSPPISSMLEF